jgi:hypothetical protein
LGSIGRFGVSAKIFSLSFLLIVFAVGAYIRELARNEN